MVNVLLDHYGKDKPAKTLNEEDVMKKGLISTDVRTEWQTFRTLLSKKSKDSTELQLKELITNDMLVAMFPNLHKIAFVGLSLPVSTASVERSFSQMKLIKTHLRNSLSAGNLSHLMKIAIESPNQLAEADLEQIVSIWNRKPRRVAI